MNVIDFKISVLIINNKLFMFYDNLINFCYVFVFNFLSKKILHMSSKHKYINFK